MAMADTQPTAAGSPARRAWWRSLNRTDLVQIAVVVCLIYKQRLGLEMMGIAPGPANLVATIGISLALTSLVRLAAGRWQISLWLLLNGLLSLLIWADVIYFRQFGDLISVAALRQAHQLSSVSDSVTVLMRRGDLKFFLDLPILAALLLLPRTQVQRWFRSIRWPAVMGLLISGLVLVTGVATSDPVLAHKYRGHTNVGSRMGLLNYHAFDVGDYANRLRARLAPNTEQVAEVRAWVAQKRAAEGLGSAGGSGASSPYWGVAQGKNVIMLQLEAFHAFPLGLEWEGQEITPNLNRLLRESISFSNFYYQTGQGVTSDADLLGNCSLFPTRTGAVYYDYAHNRYRCMPSVLREQGYKAVAMQAMQPDFWNLAAVYPQVGFEEYYSLLNYENDEQKGISLSDESFLRQSVAKLKALPQPYYAFLVTLTSHGPFWFENLPTTLNLGELSGTKAGSYLNAIHYTDMAVGKFIDQLKAEGILENAVLVVYGDHYGVHRYDTGMEQMLGLSGAGEVAWTKVEKRVPLLIRLPGGQLAGQQEQAAGQVDIAPTLAGLLGVPTDRTLFMGRDLLATSGGVVPFYRGSAVDDTHLYLSADDHEGTMACYDLATGAQTQDQACDSLQERAAEQLRISRLLIERDLIPAVLKDAQ